jgi:hypothetical protein
MGKVIEFRMTKKAIYRAAKKEVRRMYQLSAGGADPIIDDASFEAFERGEIDEVRWMDWASYCEMVLNRIAVSLAINY